GNAPGNTRAIQGQYQGGNTEGPWSPRSFALKQGFGPETSVSDALGLTSVPRYLELAHTACVESTTLPFPSRHCDHLSLFLARQGSRSGFPRFDCLLPSVLGGPNGYALEMHACRRQPLPRRLHPSGHCRRSAQFAAPEGRA